MEDLYNNSNATNKYTTVYENGKQISFYHIYSKFDLTNISDPDELPPPTVYRYNTLEGNGKCKSYDLFSYNCVQASMDVLLKGEFYKSSKKYREVIDENSTNRFPNNVYDKLKSA